MDRISEELIEATKNWVQNKLSLAESGHDWWHIQRVFKTAIKLAHKTGADLTIVALAALLHDISDTKFVDHPGVIEEEMSNFLVSHGASTEQTQQVMYIVRNMSFRHSSQFSGTKSIEFQVVQDADRLDAMGAIGIARAFSYGGYKKRPFMTVETRKQVETMVLAQAWDESTISHFYEKLLLLKGLMNTSEAAEMAVKRHQFMLQWLDQFYDEWEGII
jgi:uncharacterized protein